MTAIPRRGKPRSSVSPKTVGRGGLLASGRGALAVISLAWTELAVAAKDAAVEFARKGPPTSADGSPFPSGEPEGAPYDSFRKDVGPPNGSRSAGPDSLS